MSVRLIEGLPVHQGEDEAIIYTLDTSNWGSNPTSISVTVKRNGTDVSDDVLTGDPSSSGDVITLPVVSNLEAGYDYRVEVKFTVSGNVVEAYGTIIAEE